MENKYTHIKELKEEEKIRKKQLLDLAKKGETTISLKLPKSEDIISPYSPKNTPVLNSDLADYLFTTILRFPIKLSIKIELEEVEQKEDVQLFKEALNNHCERELNTIAIEKMRTNNKVLFFTIIGLIILSIVFSLSFIENNNILFESISIIAWVFLWEATDLFVFEKRRLQRDSINCHRLKNAPIIINEKNH